MRRVIETWARLFPEDELIVALRRQDVDVAGSQIPAKARVAKTYLSLQGLSAILELPVLALKHKVDVTISHNFTPLFGPSAVFIQDFMFLSNPEWFTRKERAYFSLMRYSMLSAGVVFSSSQTEGKRIAKYAIRKISPVPIGLAGNAELLQALPKRPEGIGVVDGFLLSVGRLNVRKNLETILIAASTSGKISERFPLVIVGEPSGKTADLPKRVADDVANGSIIFLGFTPEDELAWLYANTNLFIFLSLDEGFGMPSLEAAAFGAELLVSDLEVFREILGDSASYVDPLNADAVSDAIRLLALPNREKGALSSELSNRYSWRSCVERMRAEVDNYVVGQNARSLS
ncbi:glycosyltransferase family 4 protein [Pseudarthrobacter siccitolerans]|uniref:glycosyltransferase family 4 protein n=1 Tax=Pseudarthrobacter siccitolerans TaxID=861266 RepID=UPI0006788B1A|nr:glycosyltransferase family 1 protein [Pseudarthrobacter siccitolerans]